MATPERRRSSIFGLLFGGAKTPAVWEVKNDDDLGLDVSPSKAAKDENKRRPRTLESPRGKDSSNEERRKTLDAPIQVEHFGSQISVMSARSNGSAYSISTATRSHGSAYSNPSERPRPRTLEGLPPISPVALASTPSVTSSERSQRQRASHIQLVPKSMLPPDALPSNEEMRRLEREMHAIAAHERRSRGQSSSSPDQGLGASSADYPDRPRSDASSSGASAGKVRIQYVPRSSLVAQQQMASQQQESTDNASAVAPPVLPQPKSKTRINRSLTAVTEETRINSEYHSDIDEEDEESDMDDDSGGTSGEQKNE